MMSLIARFISSIPTRPLRRYITSLEPIPQKLHVLCNTFSQNYKRSSLSLINPLWLQRPQYHAYKHLGTRVNIYQTCTFSPSRILYSKPTQPIPPTPPTTQQKPKPSLLRRVAMLTLKTSLVLGITGGCAAYYFTNTRPKLFYQCDLSFEEKPEYTYISIPPLEQDEEDKLQIEHVYELLLAATHNMRIFKDVISKTQANCSIMIAKVSHLDALLSQYQQQHQQGPALPADLVDRLSRFLSEELSELQTNYFYIEQMRDDIRLEPYEDAIQSLKHSDKPLLETKIFQIHLRSLYSSLSEIYKGFIAYNNILDRVNDNLVQLDDPIDRIGVLADALVNGTIDPNLEISLQHQQVAELVDEINQTLSHLTDRSQ